MFVILLIWIKITHYKFTATIYKFIYLLLSIIFILYIILEDYTQSTDYLTYISRFTQISNMDFNQILVVGPFEILFRLVAWIFLVFFEPEITHKIFIVLINAIVLISFYRIFNDKFYSIIALLIYLHTPFLSVSSNILRQSLGLALILFAFTIKRKVAQKVLLIFIPFIHVSSWPIILYLIIKEKISQKFLIVIYLISAVLFLTSINRLIFGEFELLSDYNSIETFTAYGAAGNRIDFFIVVLFLTLLSIYLYKKKIIHTYFINYLLVASSYFYMMGFQAFSDRYAIYVWYFIPILFTYISIMILEKRGMKKNESFS